MYVKDSNSKADEVVGEAAKSILPECNIYLGLYLVLD